MGVRQYAWAWSLSFARLAWNVSRYSEPPTWPPYHYTLLVRSIISAMMLVLLWDLSNAAFDTYLAQQPLKKGKPLTDGSKDPNGRLIDGLNSRKELVRTFAFWELLTISLGFEERRKGIFADIDREGSSSWNQILKISLGTIENIHNRITDVKKPPPEMTLPGGKNTVAQELPRLSAPLQEGIIFSPAPNPKSRGERYSSRAASVAKYYGESPLEESPLQKLAVSTRDKILTERQRNALKPESMFKQASSVVGTILQTPIGVPFRQTFAFRSRAKVFGTPTNDLEVMLYAVDAITYFAASSLTDDQYGTVHKTIPLIIRTLVNTTGSINRFLSESPVHWSDVEFSETNRLGKNVPGIDELLRHLKSSLEYLIVSFEDYATDLGLGSIEIREARKAAGLPV
ncbi:MAG: hypothetical protein MMC23_009407 [Stictis urceolatum]|nr:hypothetical protein [Stictis urceolata]